MDEIEIEASVEAGNWAKKERLQHLRHQEMHNAGGDDGFFARDRKTGEGVVQESMESEKAVSIA